MKLPNRLLAVAALPLALGAYAADEPPSIVEMYGTVFPVFDNAETSGATQTAPAAASRPSQLPATAYTGANDLRRNRITVGTTNWGFRGYESLGGDLKLVWQLESGFQIDQNTGPGLGARDSKVGLRNRWGEIFMGQWDTPYKYISLPVNPLRGGYVFDRTAITGNPGMGVGNTTTQFTRVGAKPDASFDRRQGNSVQYWSPNFAGLSFRVGYSVDEQAGAVVAGGPVIKPVVFAASAQYDVGTLSLRYAYEEHKDYFGMSQLGGSAAGTATNSSSKDRGHKLVALWRIGNTRLTGLYEQLEYKNGDNLAGAVKSYKRNAWYGVIEQFFANKSSVFVSYGKAAEGSCERVGGTSCITSGLGANYLTAGYIYRFSKRTEVFAMYYRLVNQESAQYSPGPMVNAVSIAPGADTNAYGVGMIHFF
jgi:predicted porin